MAGEQIGQPPQVERSIWFETAVLYFGYQEFLNSLLLFPNQIAPLDEEEELPRRRFSVSANVVGKDDNEFKVNFDIDPKTRLFGVGPQNIKIDAQGSVEIFVLGHIGGYMESRERKSKYSEEPEASRRMEQQDLDKLKLLLVQLNDPRTKILESTSYNDYGKAPWEASYAA